MKLKFSSEDEISPSYQTGDVDFARGGISRSQGVSSLHSEPVTQIESTKTFLPRYHTANLFYAT